MSSKQLSLFDTDILMKDAAVRLSVSEATVRNWVHEGILHATGNALPLREVEAFMNEGFKKKLRSRANKTQKDSHDQDKLSELVHQGVKNSMLSGEELAAQYESSLSESYRNKEGVFYTPSEIVFHMLKSVEDVECKTFLDPCCGSGNFLVAALEKGFRPENLYAFDTDANAVQITRKRILEKSGVEPEHIVCGDFLAWAENHVCKFDYIFTNPPWGKKIQKQEKTKLAKAFFAGNSSDTCALFFFASLSLLNKNGVLGLLLPEAFFNIGVFEDARTTLLKHKIIRLIDYGKPFRGLMTKAKAFLMENSENSCSSVSCESFGKSFSYRTQNAFQSMPKHIINFDLSEEEFDVIKRVYSVPHITLKGHASWALGIVTGNNEKHCKTERGLGDVPIYRGKDIFPDHVVNAGIFIDRNLKDCQQVAPLAFYQAPEKVIYRFINNRIVCYHDKEQRYVLNSANLFILDDDFPLAYQQLVDLLNSDFMNWLFRSIFSTHKILRGDLEELPIWTAYFKEYQCFDERALLSYLNIEKNNGTYRIKKTN